jgi:hypothetical protein
MVRRKKGSRGSDEIEDFEWLRDAYADVLDQNIISARGFTWAFSSKALPHPLKPSFFGCSPLSLAVFVWEFELLPRSKSPLFKVS